MPAIAQPRTTFDWPIYADATFAGLAVLIPIPFIDWAFEQFFRRRMVPAIARRRGQELPPAVLRQLTITRQSCLVTCLALPAAATLGLIKRTSRKILYVLTIKDAAGQLSRYWQQAFLIDYMIGAGHLEAEASAQAARQAMDHVLQTSRSPLIPLARHVINGAHHVLRTLWKARRGDEDEVIRQSQARMTQGWAEAEDYFKTLAAHYDQTYHQMIARQPDAG